MTAKTLYLGGPEVFLPDAPEIGRRRLAACAAADFRGLFPFDVEAPGAPTPRETARAIFAANCAAMHEADAGLFNLSPFRGPHADPGTAFELGFMLALGKPVFAYSHRAGALVARLDGAAAADGVRRDASGCAIENFGLADNLMLCAGLEAQGRFVAVEEADPLRGAGGFLACLALARRHFDAA
ncbi:nucleoside 2-deoxyribosyltransferase [Methylocella sp.]|uniref:nucleoside 2-deoxyribosyltransferase n=1 Tax=Methylocella sp. TaxID=1978226 RepID=UPI003784E1FE